MTAPVQGQVQSWFTAFGRPCNCVQRGGNTMRNLVVASVLAVAGVFGLGLASPAKAGETRIFVDLGNVYFSAGQPYYRETREPLYVEIGRASCRERVCKYV